MPNSVVIKANQGAAGAAPWPVDPSLPPGAATESTLAGIAATLTEIDADLSETLTVTGAMTVSNFPASVEISNDVGNPLPVSGTVTAHAGTGPWPVTDNNGSLTIDSPQLPALVGGRVPVDGSGVTQPVSGTVGVTGVATEATLALIKADVDKIPTSPSTDRTTAGGPASVRLSNGSAFITPTTPSDTQPVSGTVTANAGTGPWPITDNGGSVTTDTPQLPAALVGGRLDVTVGAALPTGANTVGKVDQGAGGASAWKVDGSAVTQPVSLAGTVTVAPGAGAFNTNVTLLNAASTVSNGTAVDVSAYTAIGITMTGGITGVVVLQGSIDGTTWKNLPLVDVATTQQVAAMTTGNLYRRSTVGLVWVRGAITTWAGGTVTLSAHLIAAGDVGPNATALYGYSSSPGDKAIGAMSTFDGTGAAKTAAYDYAGAAISATGTTGYTAVTNVLNAIPQFYNGSAMDAQRAITTRKSANTQASGNTAVWTPTTGKKFRIMRLMILLTGQATQTSSGTLTVSFQDNTTDLGISVPIYVPALALNALGDAAPIWIDLGNGALSATANSVLNVNLSAALTAGVVAVIALGMEE
jgi:hypothetical protein